MDIIEDWRHVLMCIVFLIIFLISLSMSIWVSISNQADKIEKLALLYCLTLISFVFCGVEFFAGFKK